MKPVAQAEFTDGLAGEQPAANEDKSQGSSGDTVPRVAARETTPATPLDPAIEPLRQLLLREAARFRQHAPGSMTVVVCMDDRTELLVHFTQRDDVIDASARCESGDLPRLGTLWPRLQQSLTPRHIQLAPLRSAAERGAGAASSVGVFHSEERGGRSNGPVTRPDWETWA
jgi:hypothetical protein